MTARTRLPKYTAKTADKLFLYEQSVQDVGWCVRFLDRVYRQRNRRPPLVLREDFCGTGLLCAEWVQSRHDRRAVGLDLCAETLAWGKESNLRPLGAAARRVRLLRRNVIDGVRGPIDVAVAFNFSYWAIHQRRDLVRYFRNVRRSLAPGGFFALDIHGGPEAQEEVYEKKPKAGFVYEWQQGPLDPIGNTSTSWIHFSFPDGSRMAKAFRYDWRVWTMAELRDALTDAGFERIDVWWEGRDDVYRRITKAENWESWLAILTASVV